MLPCYQTASGFGITVGVHRLWAHRSYEACLPVRCILMLCNCIANQTSIYNWAKDHRIHHKYVEVDADPHNARRGFFFAHMGWLLLHKHPAVRAAAATIDCSDIWDDPVVRWQQRVDPYGALYLCFVMPAQVAYWGWGEDFWTALCVAGVLRYCCVLHCTWLINSAGHLFGDRPYNGDGNGTCWATENPILSFLALGEGWHNWHHKYPFDYAASEYGIWSQFNPSKAVIDGLAAMGWAWNLKRGTGAWELCRKRRRRMREQQQKNRIVPVVDTNGRKEE